METVTRHFLDLGYTVIAKADSYRVSYEIYEIVGVTEPEQLILWHEKGAADCDSAVDKIEGAELYAHGFVKWDGCSDWQFDEQDRLMLHQCDRDGLLNFGKILAACWDMTKELCPAFDA